MSGEGCWSDETGARGVWTCPSPPPQTTASVLGNTEQWRSVEKRQSLWSYNTSNCEQGHQHHVEQEFSLK